MALSQSTIAVRRATQSDVATLVELMREFYAEANYPLDQEWAEAAFSSLRYTMEHGALSGHIDDLFVKPEFRRRRIACALLSELCDECKRRGCKSIYVEVGDRNVAAIELYRRFGLEPFQDGRVLFHGGLQAAGTAMR
jgi:GNAT superfamily N-acetyltransferase